MFSLIYIAVTSTESSSVTRAVTFLFSELPCDTFSGQAKKQ